MLQWHRTGESPSSQTTINSLSELVGGGMTVPVQRGSMAVLQPPRSRFMITDILAGSGGGGMPHGDVRGSLHMGSGSDGGRSPTPSPRDLSLQAGSRHHMHHDPNDDSDSDSSGQLDDHSVCSNGE